jgi:hypothetical protein
MTGAGTTGARGTGAAGTIAGGAGVSVSCAKIKALERNRTAKIAAVKTFRILFTP